MDLAAVMAALGTRLETIPGVRIYPYPPDKVAVPAVLVSWPDGIDYDQTMAGGSDRVLVPVFVLVEPGQARTRVAELAQYTNRAGASSVKAALQAAPTLAGAAKTLRVVRSEFTTVEVAAVAYPAARLDVEVYA